MTKHVVFLAPDVFPVYREYVRGLKEVGARVTGIGQASRQLLDPQLKGFLDGYVQVKSLLQAEPVKEAVGKVHAAHAVDQVETADEALVLVAAEARERVGIPGLSAHTARLCRDKPAMKQALREAGIPCAAFIGSSSLDELRQFAEREGFPLVVKPRAALGAMGTYRVESMAELERAARELGIEGGASVAVEEFVEGHEGFYDTLAVGGEVVHEFISHYYPSVLTAMRDRRISPQIAATNRVDGRSYNELKELGRKVIQVLGIGTSATHMEWFFGPKGLKFSEIGARPPGERIWDLYCTGNDMDLYREWAMIVIHGCAGSYPSRRFATGSVQVRPDREGRIAGHDGLHDVLQQCRPWITRFHVAPVGAATVPLAKGYLCNTWFRLHHPDYDQLRHLMDFIGSRLKVRAVA